MIRKVSSLMHFFVHNANFEWDFFSNQRLPSILGAKFTNKDFHCYGNLLAYKERRNKASQWQHLMRGRRKIIKKCGGLNTDHPPILSCRHCSSSYVLSNNEPAASPKHIIRTTNKQVLLSQKKIPTPDNKVSPNIHATE